MNYIAYKNIDGTITTGFKIYNITDTRFELIRKLYHYFYD